MLLHIPEASLVDQAEPKLRKAGKSEETGRSTECSRGSISVKLPYMHIHYKIYKDAHPRIFAETVFARENSLHRWRANSMVPSLLLPQNRKPWGLK